MENKDRDKVYKSELAYFLHRIVSTMQNLTDNRDKKQEIGTMHEDIYLLLEKPKV